MRCRPGQLAEAVFLYFPGGLWFSMGVKLAGGRF